jgi:AcrR family transcriptional regulator
MGHREALLDAAKRLLQERGYARTTARDLVAASDTNLASIGYHFGSKEALLFEALHELFVEWTVQLTRAALAPPDAGPLQRLDASWVEMLSSFEERRPMAAAWAEAIAQSVRSEDLRERLAAHMQQSRDAVAAAVVAALGEDAAERGADPQLVASFLMAVCDGLLVQFLIDPASSPSGAKLADALGAATALAIQLGGGEAALSPSAPAPRSR